MLAKKNIVFLYSKNNKYFLNLLNYNIPIFIVIIKLTKKNVYFTFFFIIRYNW